MYNSGGFNTYINLWNHPSTNQDTELFIALQSSLLAPLSNHTLSPPLTSDNHWSVLHCYSFVFWRIRSLYLKHRNSLQYSKSLWSCIAHTCWLEFWFVEARFRELRQSCVSRWLAMKKPSERHSWRGWPASPMSSTLLYFRAAGFTFFLLYLFFLGVCERASLSW